MFPVSLLPRCCCLATEAWLCAWHLALHVPRPYLALCFAWPVSRACLRDTLYLWHSLCSIVAKWREDAGNLTQCACPLPPKGIGSGLLYVSSLSTNIELFPESYRGKLVGLLVSLFGLSALVYTTLYQALFSGTDVLPFLAMMACTCGGSAILGAGVFPRVLHQAGCSRWAKDGSGDPQSRHVRCFWGKAFGLSPFPPMVCCLTMQPLHLRRSGASSSLRRSRDAFVALMKDRVFWLFFAIFFLISGNGLFVINNAASIAKSADPAHGPAMKTGLVIALSACNWLGRLASGVISDALTSRCNAGSPPLTRSQCTGIICKLCICAGADKLQAGILAGEESSS